MPFEGCKAVVRGAAPGIRLAAYGSAARRGALAASSVTFVSAKQLDAVVPSGAASAQITVTNTAAPAGTVESAAVFEVR